MKKLIVLLFGALTLISCGATREIPREKLEVLKVFAKNTSAYKIPIYYKSISEKSNFYNEWKKIIKNMKVMAGFSQALADKMEYTIDSLYSLEPYTSQQKDSIKNAVIERNRIKPWTLLSLEDKEYMIYQVENYKSIKWTLLNPSFTLLHSKSAGQASLPFISKNSKYAIIFYYEPGSHKSIRVFKKENGEWKFYFEGILVIYD